MTVADHSWAPSGNAAFDEARAGGVIDTFLGFPAARSEQAKKFDFIRAITNDKETQEMEFPAQYMFKDKPVYEELDDPVAETLQLMDKHGITTMLPGIAENESAQRACRDYPDRFKGMANVDPNTGMDGVRGLEKAVKEDGAIAAHTWGAGLNPQVEPTTRRCIRSTQNVWS